MYKTEKKDKSACRSLYLGLFLTRFVIEINERYCEERIAVYDDLITMTHELSMKLLVRVYYVALDEIFETRFNYRKAVYFYRMIDEI